MRQDTSLMSPLAAEQLTDMRGGIPRAALEIIRRVFLMAGLLTSVWLALVPAGGLLRLQPADFAADQERYGREATDNAAFGNRLTGISIDPAEINRGRGTLDEFIARQTKDRLVQVQGQEWDQLYNQVADNLEGRSTSLNQHLSHDTGSSYLYFPTNHGPLPQVLPKVTGSDPFTYVRIDGGAKPRYMEVLYQRPSDTFRYAPAWLLYPSRSIAMWFALAGVLLYAFLPWAKYAPEAVVCKRARAVVVPDLLGAVMACAFFAMPLLILTREVSSYSDFRVLDFSDGWGWLTVILWAFATGGLSICVVALWYATFGLLLLPDGIRRVTLWGHTDWRYSDMTGVEPAVWTLPRWLRILMFFGALLNWRYAGTMILGASRQALGIALPCRNGRRLTIWLEHLQAGERIFRALAAAKIPMDAELKNIIDQLSTEAH